MCKNCEWYMCFKDDTKEQLKERMLEGIQLHKRPVGYSGYPGAQWCFGHYLDCKETLEAICDRAKKEGFEDIVELCEKHCKELIDSLKGYIGLN